MAQAGPEHEYGLPMRRPGPDAPMSPEREPPMEAVIRDFKALRYEERNGVARITLNRPEVLNAFGTAMMDETA